MVIVHIANLDPAVIGGVQTAVPEMVKAQSAYAHVALVNTHGETVEGIPTIRYDGAFDVDAFPEPFCKPDLVVFHEVYRFEYIGIYRLLKKRRIPYVILPHGCFSKKAQEKKRLKKTVANIVFFNAFVKNARLVQYLSDNEKTMSVLKNTPSCVLGNGVVVPQEKVLPFSKNAMRFVYIGRLELHIKGLDLLLAAIDRCAPLLRECGAVVEIYGPNYDGAHEVLTGMIEQYSIADIVRLGAEKMGDEKKRILRSATCFMQTSRTEGLPLGPLEALSYGVPCIVTRGVGLGGVIESYGAGYQCDTTAQGIAQSIERFVCEIDNVETMSQSAVRLIAEKFDIETIAKRTVDGYCELLNDVKG